MGIFSRPGAVHCKRNSMLGQLFLWTPKGPRSIGWKAEVSVATKNRPLGSHGSGVLAVHMSAALLCCCMAFLTGHSAFLHNGCSSMTCGCGCFMHISYCFTPLLHRAMRKQPLTQPVL